MTRALVLAALVSLVLQDAPQRFASGVEIVTVDALVQNGRSVVVGLSAADFELRDNGVVQTVRDVSLEQLPVRIALVLDVSGSVKGERLEHLRAAATSIVERMRPSDRASLAAFSHQLRNLVPLTADRQRLLRAVGNLDAGGGTALRDATFAALAQRDTGPGRTLVVLFSDGIDTSSFLTDADVLRAVQQSDAVIYPVGVRTMAEVQPRKDVRIAQMNAQQEQWDTKFLRDVADASGGRLVFAEGNRDIGSAFARVLDEFNSRYVLTYTPRGVDGAGWHQIDLRLKSKKGTITARRGYVGER